MELPIVDNGKVLQLATGETKAKLKRWKTLITNKTVSKQQEGKIKTGLMHVMMKNIGSGRIKCPMFFKPEPSRMCRMPSFNAKGFIK